MRNVQSLVTKIILVVLPGSTQPPTTSSTSCYIKHQTGFSEESGRRVIATLRQTDRQSSSSVCLDDVQTSRYEQFCEEFGDCEGAWGRRGVLEDGS